MSNSDVKMETFCKEYLIDFNGKRAAIAAGYSAKTAEVQASKMLRIPKVRDFIMKGTIARNKRLEITQDDVLRDIIKLKDRCMQGALVERWDKELQENVPVTDEDGRNVWKFDSQGAAKALDMLAKYTGFYEADNMQKSVSININHEAVEVERD